MRFSNVEDSCRFSGKSVERNSIALDFGFGFGFISFPSSLHW